jgi:hypothetical protein
MNVKQISFGGGEGLGDGTGGGGVAAVVLNFVLVLPPFPYCSVYDTTFTSYSVPGASCVRYRHCPDCTLIDPKKLDANFEADGATITS